RKRYKQYYNIDVNDFGHYDYYLDTTKMTKKEVAQAVFAFVSERLDKAKK
ncbi:cytidylate kinase, partial [Candidatus Falkowbacteria bacterium]|nr:cytidylate kinase [Candidatus Falkowbacteria bacterium]